MELAKISLITRTNMQIIANKKYKNRYTYANGINYHVILEILLNMYGFFCLHLATSSVLLFKDAKKKMNHQEG